MRRTRALLPCFVFSCLFSCVHSVFAQATGTRTIVFTASGAWQIPNNANITTLVIEAWGAGGGGSTAGGGQGGSYFKATLPFSPQPLQIQQLNVIVGTGGTGGAPGSNGTSGGTTSVNLGTTTLTAGGGAGAGTGGAGTFGNPTSTNTINNISFRGVNGQFGSVSKMLSTNFVSSTATTAVSSGGDGGNAGNTAHTGGFGGTETCTLTAPASGFQPFQCNPYPAFGTVIGAGPLGVTPSSGVAPGGGGGGAPLTSVYSKKIPGASGAAGLVIVTY